MSEPATAWRTFDYAPAITVLPPDGLVPYLARGQRVLELGCGCGLVAHSLAERGFIVTGIDVNNAAITEARTVAENRGFTDAQFIVGDILWEPHVVEHGAFDAVLLIRLLTCFPDEGERNRLLATAGAALKPRGLLYVRDFLLSAGYRARYDAAARNGLPYGNFPVRDAEGAVQFVAHHHTESEARGMLSAYEPLLFDSQESLSMNGNPCTLFEFIGRRSGAG